MQQRRVPVGRPSGTDGSDFSYRMVVDSRYTRVTQGKSRLKALIAAQIVNQVLGSLFILLSAIQGHEFDKFAVLSMSVGFLSLIIGEIGRKRSQSNLLRVYIFMSCFATAFSVVCFGRSDVFLKVLDFQNVAALANHELLEVAHILFGVTLQIFVIFITLSLVQNMSPPKRSS